MGKLKRIQDFSSKDIRWGCWAELETILEWMDGRHISHLDILTIVSDSTIVNQTIQDCHYQVVFVDVEQAKMIPKGC